MEPIEVSKLDELMAKHAELKAAVDSFGATLDEIQTYANETNVVVKDILSGRQISEWIQDLKTFGTSADTYSNSDRMNTLLADSDAAKNPDVEGYILQWALANNKFGTYLNTAIGTVSGVNWTSLTTPEQVFSNSTAANAVFGSSVAFNNILDTGGCGQAIVDNYTITESLLENNPVSWGILTSRKQRVMVLNAGSYTTVSKDNIAYYLWDYQTGAAQGASASLNITLANGSAVSARAGSQEKKTGEVNGLVTAYTTTTTTGTTYLAYVDLG